MKRDATRAAVAILLMLTGAFVILSVYVRTAYPSAFHLPIMAADAAFLAAVGLSRVRLSAASGGAFVLLAVPVNVVALAGAVGDIGLSALIAFMSTLLCTGLTGLILLSRSDKPLSKMTKVSVTGLLLQMTILGPVLFLAGLGTDLWIISLPMMLLTLVAFLMFNAYHSSETTLPSDRWT